MAWSMALDLGLNKAPRPNVAQHDGSLGSKSLEGALIEDRRSLLSCYLMCCMAAIALRRPTMARFSTLMAESIELIETSSSSNLLDRRLCAWVRLQRIMEQYSTAVAGDDPADMGSLTEPRVQYAINGFHKQLKDWNESLAPGVLNESLSIFYHVNIVYIHELVMYVDHDPEDFKPPFVVKSVAHHQGEEKLSPIYIDAIWTVQSSTQALLDAFLRLDVKELQALPIVNYVRVTYGIVMLTKLSLSAMAANNPLGQLLDARNIQAAAYQDRLLTHLARAIGSLQFRVASKFFVIIFKLRSWYVKYGVPVSQKFKEEEQIEPCNYLGPEHDPYANPAGQNEDFAHGSQSKASLYSLNNALPPQYPSIDMPMYAGNEETALPFGVDLFSADMSGLMSEPDFDGLIDLGMDFDFDLGSWPL
ncbi:MAG: hypothetical protein Q9168_002384 [Polycauliona sp. 1 TL-2023]